VRERASRRAAWLLTVVLLAVAAVGLLTGTRQPLDRAAAIEQRLRCPTCQSVSVADSPSETAAAMRATVRQQVDAGRSDQEILTYFKDRYGAWVLFDPPVRGRTSLVWLLPAVAAVVATGAVVRLSRDPAAAEPLVPLSAEERLRVREESKQVRDPEEEP